jgi:hypothetical protein
LLHFIENNNTCKQKYNHAGNTIQQMQKTMTLLTLPMSTMSLGTFKQKSLTVVNGNTDKQVLLGDSMVVGKVLTKAPKSTVRLAVL